ncbi:hypothetical protein DTO164E3_1580 [Paecilomyces variotii]|uniref:Palmitoyltransferase n=1 Tax=Byssochlamys spectabilis TaxID=264951 RepID=A0A443I4A6_BYSSP|nr:putative DHHC zinc finger membrane protein [Paecilomyces variotii]KAJ9202977.1 hypothetical protein DTO032I3_3351 [Paecilomyces variotii]KAJ9204957.1 hypothetical protein DTO164E3_1580 [Paecilomyces variotii]KAJ9225636.1 hypothetical protein DTO169C6_2072 [Paecilomyces variotii]KAJ9248502.1 hypothetical protein DTO195F2_8821 [Paecilomyces variotii]KAJ9277324.1 hypothetical protein DTO021D3_5789 [Paecilomyces variotii]
MTVPGDSSEATEPTPSTPTTTQEPLDVPRPPSVGDISSRMTDIASEDGDESSRPNTRRSSQPWAQMPSSRRGPPPARNSLTSSQAASRPTSSGSRMSRSHAPSLAAQGFFRPMSSQRLQAHRGTRPLARGGASSPTGETEEGDNKRRSLISNSTLRQGTQLEDVPPSRGTEFTDPIIPDRGTSNASPVGNTTVRSLGESVRLLQDREKKSVPQTLNLSVNYRNPGGQNDPPQRSPLSFRSGLLSLQSKNENPEGHERLSSTVSTPRTLEAKAQHAAAPQKKMGKNYEYFTGNTVFWGSGRFQNARDKPVNIATGILVALPAGLFFGFSAPWLWHHISPAIPILFAYLFYVCMSSFIHASVVDPGIIPRNLHVMPPPDAGSDPLAVGPPTTDWVMIKLATSDVAAMDVPVKYCKTCNIWRPPRCYHCRVCDNCVETLDHHCVWLNNCVGRRNYRYFFTFVSSATLLALFLIGASLAHILVYRHQHGITFGKAIDHWRVPWAMVIYGALAAPYPGSLWAYHLFLMGRGETTREYLSSHKFQKADRYRPFDQGNIFRNWIAVLGRPRPPTYLQFKRPYQEGDQRFATRKRKDRINDLEAQMGMEMQEVPPSSHGATSGSRPPT